MKKGLAILILFLVLFVWQSTLYASTKLELWTFVNTHARFFRQVAESFKKIEPDVEIDVKEIEYSTLFDKLAISLQTGVGAPDLVDIEQGVFGRFLKGDIKLVPLNIYLKKANKTTAIAKGRQALYTYLGNVYGLEHALCPVVLYYRWDIFQQAAIKTPLVTWNDWIQAGQKLTALKKFISPLPPFDILLRQRKGNFFDEKGNIVADSPLVIETLKWILATRDEHKVTEIAPSGPAFWGAVREGRYATLIGADWYGGFIRDNVPETRGKWKAQALPVWEKGGLDTSTSGGTGLCMTVYAKDRDKAWKFMEYAQLTKENAILRYKLTTLFPPLIEAWDAPELREPDPFFSNQRLGALFATVGRRVPQQINTPFTPEWNDIWGNKYGPAVRDLKISPEEGLKKAAEDVRKLMQKK